MCNSVCSAPADLSRKGNLEMDKSRNRSNQSPSAVALRGCLTRIERCACVNLLDDAYAFGDLLEFGAILVAAGLNEKCDNRQSVRFVFSFREVLVLGIIVYSVRLHRILHALQRVLASRLIRVRPVKVQLLEHILIRAESAPNDIWLLFALAKCDHGRGASVLNTCHPNRLPMAMILERINVIDMLDSTIANLNGRLHGHAV